MYAKKTKNAGFVDQPKARKPSQLASPTGVDADLNRDSNVWSKRIGGEWRICADSGRSGFDSTKKEEEEDEEEDDENQAKTTTTRMATTKLDNKNRNHNQKNDIDNHYHDDDDAYEGEESTFASSHDVN